jgi:putative NADH-flavin reductase
MKATIFGVSGAAGTCLVDQALKAGHEVTAVVRDPARMMVPAHEELRVLAADVMDSAEITPAIAGAGAVITAIGPHGTARSTLRADSTRSIMQAMRKAGARRLLVISGSVVADEGESFYLRYLLKPVARRTFLRHPYADFVATEHEVRASDLDWTIVRPPSLNNRPGTGRYRQAVDRSLRHCFGISRADLAVALIGMLADPATIHRHIVVAA